jgi:Ca-activated chloride channel family protein
MNARQARLIVLAVVAGVVLVDVAPVDPGAVTTGKVDDWQYDGGTGADLDTIRPLFHIPLDTVDSFMAGSPYDTAGTIGAPLLSVPVAAFAMMQSTISTFSSGGPVANQAGPVGQSGSDLGLAAGGAQDINNFRDNLNESYLPIPTDLSYEGLFYEYYFDTGQQEPCEQLFCPSYSRAVTADPLTDETEQYMTVGLNSDLDADMFERKKLNLVLVLDISGSMGSGFDQYYYDRFGNRHEIRNSTDKSKIQVAAESLAALTEHLEDGDRLGVVLFNNGAATAKPLRLTEETDMAAIRDHMLEVSAGGGTNMEAGMAEATDMLQEYADADRTEYENRIIFLTDAMPNIGRTGATGDDDLLSMVEDNAADGIYTTFVGIGLDFQTELVDAITAVRGANYYSVHSSEQFNERMDDEFEYMVTPLVFNLSLRLDSDQVSIEQVYGSTAAEESTGQIMKVNTLFPSPTEEGRTRGGVVLLQLNGTAEEVGLEASYVTRDGESHSTSRTVTFEDRQPEYFENTGVRKAVLLTRYADLMKNWMIYEHDQAEAVDEEVQPAVEVAERDGIEPPHPSVELGQWERQSVPLHVSDRYADRIGEFRTYFRDEADAIGDETLDQEDRMMEKIVAAAQ